MSARILLVEDDPVSRDLLAALLASRGHTVETAEDGFNALRLAQETPYDLVFIDYHLPEMDGYALARLIRSLSEKASRNLKMVAITADRFGLAARRGADTIFDHMLAKPIEPDALFAFVETLVASIEPPALEDLETFLAGPAAPDAQSAAKVLWRVRGIGALPSAATFPAPSPSERAGLEYCFRLVEPEVADCLVLLSDAGRPALERARAEGARFLQPLFAIDDKLAPLADVHFKVGDGESWSMAAVALTRFAAGRGELDVHVAASKDFATRLLAYLIVADRDLILRRDECGHAILPYTGGFAVASLIEGIRCLAARGLVTTHRRSANDEGQSELAVRVTEKGAASLSPTRRSMRP